MTVFPRVLPIVLLLAVSTGGWAAEGPVPAGVLTLFNGGSVPGRFQTQETGEAVRWQGTAFAQPFEFVPGAVTSVRFPAATEPVKPQGEFAVELIGGDVLTGRITHWSDGRITLQSPHFGTVKLQSAAVRRMYRIDENPMLVYSGPSGLTGWEPEAPGWKEDGPHVWTDTDQSMLSADLDVPDRAIIEFELSWTQPPIFVFAVGVNPDLGADTRLDGWRFETWGGGAGVLAVVREGREVADVAGVQTLSEETKRIHLIACLDQEAGTMQVYRPDGALAGEIAVPPAKLRGQRQGRAGRGVRIVNRYGDIRLERLRIAHWNGLPPSPSGDEPSRFELADGTVVSGEIAGLGDAHEFVIRQQDGERTVAARDVVAAEFSPSAQPPASDVSAVLQDGTRVSGAIGEFRNDALVVAGSFSSNPFVVPYRHLRSLLFLKLGEPAQLPQPEGRSGRLELGEHKLPGALAPTAERAGASCLAWHPVGSRTGSPLKPDAAGRIVYRDAAKPAPAEQDPGRPVPAARQVPGRVQPRGNFASIFLKKAAEPPQTRPQGPAQNVHLLSGDVIPCMVLSIDEQGVHIDSPVAEAAVVPHEKIKAVELSPGASPPDLQQAKKERLLTVPRLQKASPPTHLLCSRNGDFLRCRLLSMRADRVVIELQLDEVEIPAERIAQIIWFHPEELARHADDNEDGASDDQRPPDQSETAPEEEPAGENPRPASPQLAQIIQPNGNRVTFQPLEVDGQALAGTSDLLGACRFRLDQIDQLIFGRQIDAEAAELVYHQWRLRPAVEPLVAQDFDDSGRGAGTVSPLVGRPAPDFELDLLNGERFRLSKHKGQVVVLDFWASWCGPCMQTMPLLEEALREFNPDEVRLISVNLEERAEHVKSVLERHKLNVTVALDIDGVAARRYEADAIPQLVVIDRRGEIARLYVGGGRTVVEQLKSAVSELLEAGD